MSTCNIERANRYWRAAFCSFSFFEHLPFAKYFYRDRRQAITPPVDLLPPGMLEVRVRELWGGDMYCITARKPTES